jgi:hypothetical protein
MVKKQKLETTTGWVEAARLDKLIFRGNEPEG